MNAADHYRRAFALLPEGDLSAYETHLDRSDAAASAFTEQGHAALDALYRGAACRKCDWGPEALDAVPVDDYAGARRLAMLALIRAVGPFDRDDLAAGYDDVVAVITMARHLGQGLYASGLAGIPIEDVAVERGMLELDRLDADARTALAARLDALPPVPPLAAAVRAERGYFQRHYRDKIAALPGDPAGLADAVRREFGLHMDTEQARAMMEWIYPDGDPADQMLRASGGDKAALLALADEVLTALDTVAALVEGEAPPDALEPALARVSANPLLAEALHTFERTRPTWESMTPRLHRLRAALDKPLNGRPSSQRN